MVEIAIRALSPAVNDTFTGVACVDWLADALLTLAERPPLEGNWYDAGSQLRLWMPSYGLSASSSLRSIRSARPRRQRPLYWSASSTRFGGWHRDFRTPAIKRCPIKRTRSSKLRAH